MWPTLWYLWKTTKKFKGKVYLKYVALGIFKDIRSKEEIKPSNKVKSTVNNNLNFVKQPCKGKK